MPTNSKDLINTHCSICQAAITIIKGRPNLCHRCKSNLAYITRHDQDSADKITDLKIRYLALIKLKKDQRLGITEAMRQTIKEINLNK